MFTRVADVLLDKGYKVYFIGQHSGTCTSPYVVIKESIPGGTLYKNLDRQIVEIYPFLPTGVYVKVQPFIEKLMDDLKAVEGLERDTGSPAYIVTDEEKKAYTTRLSYFIIKRRR